MAKAGEGYNEVGRAWPDVIAPPYAAIVGTLMVYPLLVLIWRRLNLPWGK
jgi:hypothetical protein